MSQKNSSFSSYYQELTRSCTGGEGIPKIVTEVPNIFMTLKGLIEDKDIQNKDRILVFAAIGYFFVPDDIFPEEDLGQIGYIDDVILGLTVFDEIASTPLGKEALKRNWKLTLDQDLVLRKILVTLMEDHPNEYIGVLDHIGLLPENIELDIE